MKKIALVAALPVILTLAACNEAAEDEAVMEDTTVATEPAPMDTAPMAEDTMAPADDTMMEGDTTTTDPMMEGETTTEETTEM